MQLSIEIREDCDEVQFGIYVKTCQCGDTVSLSKNQIQKNDYLRIS